MLIGLPKEPDSGRVPPLAVAGERGPEWTAVDVADVALGLAVVALEGSRRVAARAGFVVRPLSALASGSVAAGRRLRWHPRVVDVVERGERQRRLAAQQAYVVGQRLAPRLVDGLLGLVDLTEMVPEHVDLDAIVAGVDVDAVVARVDLERIIDRIDVDGVVARVDLERIIDRIDVDAVVARADLQAVLGRVDVDDVVARVDLERIIDRIDVDAVVARADLQAVLARVDVDDVVARVDLERIIDRIDVDAVVGASRPRRGGRQARPHRARRVRRRRDRPARDHPQLDRFDGVRGPPGGPQAGDRGRRAGGARRGPAPAPTRAGSRVDVRGGGARAGRPPHGPARVRSG